MPFQSWPKESVRSLRTVSSSVEFRQQRVPEKADGPSVRNMEGTEKNTEGAERFVGSREVDSLDRESDSPSWIVGVRDQLLQSGAARVAFSLLTCAPSTPTPAGRVFPALRIPARGGRYDPEGAHRRFSPNSVLLFHAGVPVVPALPGASEAALVRCADGPSEKRGDLRQY